MIKIEIRNCVEMYVGEHYYSFTRQEFEDFCGERVNVFNYGSKFAKSEFGRVTFFSFEPNKDSGETSTNYVRFSLPLFGRKVLNRVVKAHWAKFKDHVETKEIVISAAQIERWEKKFSQGSGSAKMNIDRTSQEFLDECLAKDNGSLAESLSRLEAITKNATQRFWEVKEYRVSKDWDGFYFTVPQFHGGIINHGSVDEPSWSIHT